MVWFNFDDFFNSTTESIKCNLVWINFELIYNFKEILLVLIL